VHAEIDHELKSVARIQQSLLPAELPYIPRIDMAVSYQTAARAGGDYYDFFRHGDRRLVVAIGDATGHGVGASLMISATKMALLTVDEPDLTERVGQINTLLKRVNRNRRLNVALTLVELSHDTGSATVNVKAAGGGMPPLYILRESGSVEEIYVEGLPLGAMETAKYGSIEFQMGKDEMLVLMSDGVPERQNDRGEMFGYAAIVAQIQKIGRIEKNVQRVLDALIRKSDAWSNNTPQCDDVTLVVLKVK